MLNDGLNTNSGKDVQRWRNHLKWKTPKTLELYVIVLVFEIKTCFIIGGPNMVKPRFIATIQSKFALIKHRIHEFFNQSLMKNFEVLYAGMLELSPLPHKILVSFMHCMRFQVCLFGCFMIFTVTLVQWIYHLSGNFLFTLYLSELWKFMAA